MEPQHVGCLSIVSSWIFMLFLPSVCWGMATPTLKLSSTVFVAFSGEDLSVNCEITKPVNLTVGTFFCFNVTNTKFFDQSIPGTGNTPDTTNLIIQMKNVSSSGIYYCNYKNTMVHWFLRVRAKRYKQLEMWDYTDTEFIVTAIFIGMLLLFSVFGSVYVFRGDWKKTTTGCGDTDEAEKQNREDRKNTEIGEDNMDVTTTHSTSFYASLEPRPRSIYEVLDRSAAKTESGQNSTKSKQKGPPEMVVQNEEPQEEGVFECVYENF